MRLTSFLTFSAALLFSVSAAAHSFKLGDLQIDHPFARPSVPGQTTGGAYLSIENQGKRADTLVSASSSAAKSVELHTMSMTGNMMKMREVTSIDVKPAEKISMAPGGGYHLMLIGLTKPLKAGEKIPVRLTFKNAGSIDVMVNIEEPKPAANAAEAPAHQHQHR